MERKQELTTKIYLPLPLVVGKMVVGGRRQNSVCGLSFGRSRGRTIADDSKVFRCINKSFIKNGKETRTHHKNIPAAASCCWQGGGVGQEAKLSLWAEFQLFLWKDHCWWLKRFRCSNKSFIKNGKETRTHHENIPSAASCCWQGGGVGREAKLSRWADFWPFSWEDHSCSTGNKLRRS